MKRNVGNLDRMIRVVLAALITLLYVTNVLTGIAAIVLLIVAGVFVLTALVGFCPLYALLGITSYAARQGKPQ